jgi:hypothetical protein
MSLFNFWNKREQLNLELNCRIAGLQFHNYLITNRWNYLAKEYDNLTFYEPFTKYDKALNTCLLLTGYHLDFKDERGWEQREFVYIFDVLRGTEEFSWEYGHGHLGGLKGSRIKDEKTIKEENYSLSMHKSALQEFRK